jgi:hypothetical protein
MIEQIQFPFEDIKTNSEGRINIVLILILLIIVIAVFIMASRNKQPFLISKENQSL